MMTLFDLNHDVLSIILSHLEREDYPHIVRMCRTAYCVGMPFLMTTIELKLYQIGSFCKFMTTDASSRWVPYTRALHLWAAVSPALSQAEARCGFAKAVTHLVQRTPLLQTFSSRCVEWLLDREPRLAEALISRTQLFDLVLRGIGPRTISMIPRLCGPIRSLDLEDTLQQNIISPSDLIFAIKPFQHTLTSLTLQQIILSSSLPHRPRFANVLSLSLAHCSLDGAALSELFPKVRDLSLTSHQSTTEEPSSWRHLHRFKTDILSFHCINLTSCSVHQLVIDDPSYGDIFSLQFAAPVISAPLLAFLSCTTPTSLSMPASQSFLTGLAILGIGSALSKTECLSVCFVPTATDQPDDDYLDYIDAIPSVLTSAPCLAYLLISFREECDYADDRLHTRNLERKSLLALARACPPLQFITLTVSVHESRTWAIRRRDDVLGLEILSGQEELGLRGRWDVELPVYEPMIWDR
ncbi:hypothetical protein JAAARDRAFT_588205 [Jaapia argillacea MUCL 33604]|uniref:F-box domain-containing protein n=1 Tax=Jaapia argillacea MUCL 33604 TaxID=933084 RepID=A0A067PH55_9AGAM|nr:hypothetical protein JAAARDRAFT_588205 [Jaapia argillacea MUCL 33604]